MRNVDEFVVDVGGGTLAPQSDKDSVRFTFSLLDYYVTVTLKIYCKESLQQQDRLKDEPNFF